MYKISSIAVSPRVLSGKRFREAQPGGIWPKTPLVVHHNHGNQNSVSLGHLINLLTLLFLSLAIALVFVFVLILTVVYSLVFVLVFVLGFILVLVLDLAFNLT